MNSRKFGFTVCVSRNAGRYTTLQRFVSGIMRIMADFYTSEQAARILGRSARRVQQLAAEGELEGERAGRGWRIYQHSVHAYLEEYGAGKRGASKAVERPQEAREWADRVADLERQLGRLEGRLELTARAESTLQAERDRLIADLDRERERAALLELELAQARRPWYKRLFGGG